MDKANWLPGNKYRRYCLECERWLPCTSREHWQTHDDARVLPADANPNDPDLVPVEDTEYVTALGPSNWFACPYPNCESENHGYPEMCPTCGGHYEW